MSTHIASGNSVSSVMGGGQSWSAYWSTLKKAGIIIRYADDEDLAALLHSQGESVTMAVSNIASANQSTIDKWKRIVAYGMDLGVWSNISASQSAFIVNSITPNNQAYYQAQDDLESEANKGILAFITYNGYNYCLQRVSYPASPLDLGAGNFEQLNFSTIAGGSNITITPTIGNYSAIYLDSTKTYASNFPASALDKWWIISSNGDGTYALKMNNVVPLADYCGAAISGSGDYSGADQVTIIKWDQFYPVVIGLKYQFQENKRCFTALGLPQPVSMAEVEQGGYASWATLQDDLFDILTDGGYKAATKNPLSLAYVNLKADDSYSQFKVPASSTTCLSALADIQAVKESIADGMAKNLFRFERQTVPTAPLDLTGWEELITWCKANSIPILSYKKYANDHYVKGYKKLQNIFPRLNKDIAGRDTGTPDGFTTLHADISLITTGGKDIDGGYYLQFTNGTAQIAKIDRLYGFSLVDNTFKLWAKNDGTATDVIRIRIYEGTAQNTYERFIYLYVNSSEWVELSADESIYEASKIIEISVSTWASSGSVDISGIEVTDKREVSLLSGYEPESSALFARMLAVNAEPNNARKLIIDSTIKKLKKAEVISGVYTNLLDKVIALHTQASHAENAAKLNWKADEFNITPGNSPAYTIDKGWTLNGVNQYLGTGYNPYSISDELKKWTLHNGTLMVYINVNNGLVNFSVDLGARPSTSNRSGIAVNYNAAYGVMGINGTLDTTYMAEAAAQRLGMYGISCINSVRLIRLIGDVASGSTRSAGTITNGEFFYGRHTTTYGTNRYAFGLIAKGMDENEMKKFASIINTDYLAKIGATV